MTRHKIRELAQCSNSTISRALCPDTKETDLIRFIRYLVNLEDNYLNKLFTDSMHQEICEIVVSKAPAKYTDTILHASDCIDFGLYLKRKANGSTDACLPSGMATSCVSTTNIITMFEYSDNYSERLFIDEQYLTLCKVAISKTKDKDLRRFASQCYNECLLLRGRIRTKSE